MKKGLSEVQRGLGISLCLLSLAQEAAKSWVLECRGL